MSAIQQLLVAGRGKFTNSLSLTAGTSTGPGSYVQVGYSVSSFGSLSPTTLIDGKSITSLFDGTDGVVPVFTMLSITGFSAEPGQNYLTSVTANSQTRLGASADFYSYGAGSATWRWHGTHMGFVNASVYPTTVIA